jgi:hypothetical protein
VPAESCLVKNREPRPKIVEGNWRDCGALVRRKSCRGGRRLLVDRGKNCKASQLTFRSQKMVAKASEGAFHNYGGEWKDVMAKESQRKSGR